jgi:hypothetical protein
MYVKEEMLLLKGEGFGLIMGDVPHLQCVARLRAGLLAKYRKSPSELLPMNGASQRCLKVVPSPATKESYMIK